MCPSGSSTITTGATGPAKPPMPDLILSKPFVRKTNLWRRQENVMSTVDFNRCRQKLIFKEPRYFYEGEKLKNIFLVESFNLRYDFKI